MQNSETINTQALRQEIGVRLKAFRKSRKLNQEYMAQVLSISIPAYSQREKGTSQLKSVDLYRLKSAFPEVDLGALILGADQTQQSETQSH